MERKGLMASWASAAGLGENPGAWAPGWPRRDPSGPRALIFPRRWASAPGSRDRLRGALALVRCGAARVNRLGAWAGEDGGGAGGGDPLRPREELDWASRVPLAGVEGFPSYRRSHLRLLRNMRGWRPRPPGPGLRAQALWPPQWIGPWAFPALEKTLAWGSWGMLSDRQPPPARLLFLFLLSTCSTDKAKAGSLMRDTEHLLCLTAAEDGEGLARADSHRQSHAGWEIINNENSGWIIVAWGQYWSFALVRYNIYLLINQ